MHPSSGLLSPLLLPSLAPLPWRDSAVPVIATPLNPTYLLLPQPQFGLPAGQELPGEHAVLQATLSQSLEGNREEEVNGFKRIKGTSGFPELETAETLSCLRQIPSRISI